MMMLEIYAGAVDRSYDFQVDENTGTDNAIKTFCAMIAKKNGMKSGNAGTEASLYDVSRGKELDRTATLKENGVVNGMKLMLV